MNESEFNNLVERLREYFEPKTELANKEPNISEVADNTSVSFLEGGKRVIKKAINGNFIELYRET
jgi:hypothetical protein